MTLTAATPGFDNVIGFSPYGELSIKVSIFDKVMEVPLKTDQYYNSVSWEIFSKNRTLFLMTRERKAISKEKPKHLEIPMKIGEKIVLMKCFIKDHQAKPFVLGMQTLLSLGFSFGIGDHRVVFKERPSELLHGYYTGLHNQVPDIREDTRHKKQATVGTQTEEPRILRRSRIPIRVVISTDL